MAEEEKGFAANWGTYAAISPTQALVSKKPGGLKLTGLDGQFTVFGEVVEGLEVAEQISQAERRAMSAERETVDRLIATHLAGRIGADDRGRTAEAELRAVGVERAEA